jgi:hypothetical protein
METFTTSRKELPRAGLVAAALAGRISNREGAAALRVSPRQFQRLKARVREAGPRPCVTAAAGVEFLRSGHSMTWSARASRDGGIVRPRALAVLRLMTSSSCAGSSTGMSDGLAPFRIFPTRMAPRR